MQIDALQDSDAACGVRALYRSQVNDVDLVILHACTMVNQLVLSVVVIVAYQHNNRHIWKSREL